MSTKTPCSHCSHCRARCQIEKVCSPFFLDTAVTRERRSATDTPVHLLAFLGGMALTLMPNAAAFGPPAAAPAVSNDNESGKIEQLRAIFPDVEADVLAQLLSYNDHSVERVVSTMLEVSAEQLQEEVDANVARRIQDEQDEEMAKAVHNSLQQELREEQERRKKQELPAKAARAMTAASASAKALLQRVRPGSSTSRQTTYTHSAPLLESPLETYDMNPVQVPAGMTIYTPPLVSTPAEPRLNDAVDTSFVMPTVDTGDRYSSRLDRARSANKMRSRTATGSPTADKAPLAPLVALTPAVPEGELI